MSLESFLPLLRPGKLEAAEALYERLTRACSEPEPDIVFCLLQAEGLLLPDTKAPQCGESSLDVTVLREDPEKTVLRAAIPETLDNTGGCIRPHLRFELLGALGEGAMGKVSLARDRELRRKVAIKRLHGELETDPELTRRFLAEAQIISQLDHPNIVPLYSLEHEAENRISYAMKVVEGDTLGTLLKKARSVVQLRQRLPSSLKREALLGHFLDVCDAVAFAHDKGIIHRDLKPANIMVGRFNQVYLMDWGIARVLDAPDIVVTAPVADPSVDSGDAPQGETAGTLLGTPKYMSPEQARGENDQLDQRSDLYSLGLILYELVCLRPAYKADSLDRFLQRVATGKRRGFPSRPGLAIDRDLRAIIDKATAFLPEKRYADVPHLSADLRNYLHDQPISVVHDNLLRRAVRWVGHHRQQALALLLASLLLGTLVAGAIWYRHTETLARVRERAILLTHYFDRVSEQGHAITQHFLFTEGLLDALAASAEQVLEHGTPSSRRYYLSREFRTPGKGPEDLAKSRHYRDFPISTEHPDVHYAGDPEADGLDEHIGRLVLLEDLLKRTFLKAYRQLELPATGKAVRALLEQNDWPLTSASIALKEGVSISYPGSAILPPDFDPVQRPWYRQAIAQQGNIICGEPYIGLGAGFRLVPCSVALYHGEGELLGAALFDLPLEHTVRALLKVTDVPLRRSLLLDDEGRVLVQLSSEGATNTRDEGSGDFQFPLYFNTGVVRNAVEGHSGLVEEQIDEEKLWLMHIHLPTLGWTYVVEIEAKGRAEKLWDIDAAD